MLELLDDRVGTRSTLITSQLPVNAWHEWLAERDVNRIADGQWTRADIEPESARPPRRRRGLGRSGVDVTLA